MKWFAIVNTVTLGMSFLVCLTFLASATYPRTVTVTRMDDAVKVLLYGAFFVWGIWVTAR